MIPSQSKILYLIGSFMDWIGRSLLGNEGKVNNSTSNILEQANIILNQGLPAYSHNVGKCCDDEMWEASKMNRSKFHDA